MSLTDEILRVEGEIYRVHNIPTGESYYVDASGLHEAVRALDGRLYAEDDCVNVFPVEPDEYVLNDWGFIVKKRRDDEWVKRELIKPESERAEEVELERLDREGSE
jgi:hypothetical protein